MSELRDLYQEVILDHYKRPRNFGPLEEPMSKAQGYNPLCGDQVTVCLRAEDGVIEDVRFEGVGCAISTASASLMTEILRGKTVTEAEQLFGQFHDLVTSDREPTGSIGKLAVLSGVRDYPSRVKCATLAWHALQAALANSSDPVATE